MGWCGSQSHPVYADSDQVIHTERRFPGQRTRRCNPCGDVRSRDNRRIRSRVEAQPSHRLGRCERPPGETTLYGGPCDGRPVCTRHGSAVFHGQPIYARRIHQALRYDYHEPRGHRVGRLRPLHGRTRGIRARPERAVQTRPDDRRSNHPRGPWHRGPDGHRLGQGRFDDVPDRQGLGRPLHRQANTSAVVPGHCHTFRCVRCV